MTAQQTQIQTWLDRLAPFEMIQTDPAVTAAMTIQLVFIGHGTNAATDADKAVIAGFAADVFVQLSQWMASACTLTGR